MSVEDPCQLDKWYNMYLFLLCKEGPVGVFQRVSSDRKQKNDEELRLWYTTTQIGVEVTRDFCRKLDSSVLTTHLTKRIPQEGVFALQGFLYFENTTNRPFFLLCPCVKKHWKDSSYKSRRHFRLPSADEILDPLMQKHLDKGEKFFCRCTSCSSRFFHTSSQSISSLNRFAQEDTLEDSNDEDSTTEEKEKEDVLQFTQNYVEPVVKTSNMVIEHKQIVPESPKRQRHHGAELFDTWKGKKKKRKNPKKKDDDVEPGQLFVEQTSTQQVPESVPLVLSGQDTTSTSEQHPSDEHWNPFDPESSEDEAPMVIQKGLLLPLLTNTQPGSHVDESYSSDSQQELSEEEVDHMLRGGQWNIEDFASATTTVQ